MKESRLSALIKKINRKKLIMPILYLIFITAVFIKNPLYCMLSVHNIDSPREINSHYSEGNMYIRCTFNDLYYTGLNHTIKSDVKASYYYCIYDDICYYVLISADDLENLSQDSSTPSYISSYTCNAKLLRDSDIIAEISQRLSKNLNWTASSLSAMSCKIIVNQYELYTMHELMVFVIMIISIIGTLIHLGLVIISLINPYLSKTVYNLKKYGNVNILFPAAEAEYEDTYAQSEGILLTQSFYIAYDKHNIHIVPLENIVWAYKVGTMNNRIMHSKITYSLYVVTNHKKHFIVHGKTKEASDSLLNSLQSRYPEILIGYNEQNSSK